MTDPDQDRQHVFRLGLRLGLASLAFAAAFLAIAFALLYGMRRQVSKMVENIPCPAAQKALPGLQALAHGDVAAFKPLAFPVPMTPVRFKGADGKPLSSADFKGKTLLLNLWATWCVPCRAEMPTLDALAAKADPALAVVTVNIDTTRFDKARAFIQDIKATHLTFYSDPTAAIFQTLREKDKLVGLPATVLVDPHGCELGLMEGPAKWDSSAALALIKAAEGA